jgi:hypothetical protein
MSAARCLDLSGLLNGLTGLPPGRFRLLSGSKPPLFFLEKMSSDRSTPRSGLSFSTSVPSGESSCAQPFRRGVAGPFSLFDSSSNLGWQGPEPHLASKVSPAPHGSSALSGGNSPHQPRKSPHDCSQISGNTTGGSGMQTTPKTLVSLPPRMMLLSRTIYGLWAATTRQSSPRGLSFAAGYLECRFELSTNSQCGRSPRRSKQPTASPCAIVWNDWHSFSPATP